ncbi:hypothetical protein CRENBAI_024278 [Crenichthys baileyi]|uniref:Uncharacterized protein n=1 Tax=Crenichthys baileyi TaxID=28760 RepID=A0AAV9SN90_9TELE
MNSRIRPAGGVQSTKADPSPSGTTKKSVCSEEESIQQRREYPAKKALSQYPHYTLRPSMKCNVICSSELWVIYFTEVWIEGTKGAGLRTTLENWDTLRSLTHQWERAIQGHKDGSASIGTGPKRSSPIRNSPTNSNEENGALQRHQLASLLMRGSDGPNEAMTTFCFAFNKSIGLQANAQEGRAVYKVSHPPPSVHKGQLVMADNTIGNGAQLVNCVA